MLPPLRSTLLSRPVEVLLRPHAGLGRLARLSGPLFRLPPLSPPVPRPPSPGEHQRCETFMEILASTPLIVRPLRL